MFSSQLFFFHANQLTHNSAKNNLEPIAGFPKMINCRQCCCCRCCCCCCRCWCCWCCWCRCCCFCSSLFSIMGKHKKFVSKLVLNSRFLCTIEFESILRSSSSLAFELRYDSSKSSPDKAAKSKLGTIFFSFTDVFGFGSELCFGRKSLRISIPANGASSPVRTLNRALNWFCRNKNSKKTKLSSVLISESLTGKWF